MNKNLIKYSILIFLINLSSIFSQDYHIKNYTVTDDLRGTCVTGAFQDKQGFMWFRTLDGVFKFDGRNFKRLDIPGDNGKIIAGGIAQGINGTLYFTSSKGLIKYDGINISITSITFHKYLYD